MQQANPPDTAERPLILIVDDDPLILAMLNAGLGKAGYEVLQGGSGEEALRLCSEHRPQLAILDIRMAGLNGIETARILNQQHGIPFMFLSAHHDKEIVNTAIREGALGYLVKPIEFSQLLPAVETALVRAAEFQSLYYQKEHLETALSQSREVSVAVGIIVTRSGLTATQAEEAMRQYARRHRIKMADVAAQIIAHVDQLNQLIKTIIS